MTQTGQKKVFIKKLRHKYRIAIFNEQTYEEVWRMRLSRLNVFTVLGSSTIGLIVLVILLIAFTNLKEYIPGYPDGQQRRLIVKNAHRVDSLIVEINKRDRFFHSIKAIVSGEEPTDMRDQETLQSLEDTGTKKQNVQFTKSIEDSVFRNEVEKEEKYNLSVLENSDKFYQLEHTYFFCPLKGLIVNKFGDSQGHYGVDVVGGNEVRVSAVLDGIIFFTGWTVETGYVIQIQHSNNLISLYKHNSKLLKKVGQHVKAGEAIANVGNSGEYTTGPHLHFELWHQGVPLNPEEYIAFE